MTLPARPEPPDEHIQRLLNEWEAEVREHGIWTSGHSLAAKMAAILSTPPPPEDGARLRALVEEWQTEAREYVYSHEGRAIAQTLFRCAANLAAALTEGRRRTTDEQKTNENALTRSHDPGDPASVPTRRGDG